MFHSRYFQPLLLSVMALTFTGPASAAEDALTAQRDRHEMPAKDIGKPAPVAMAELKPTEGHEAIGEVSFLPAADGEGLEVVVRMTQLTPGMHGFHIHSNGDCSAPDASSAGGHFNPDNMPHGARSATERHVGDLGNLVANDAGEAVLDIDDAALGRVDLRDLIGKAVIVHATADDSVSQPSGNAGARVACGVISAV